MDGAEQAAVTATSSLYHATLSRMDTDAFDPTWDVPTPIPFEQLRPGERYRCTGW